MWHGNPLGAQELINIDLGLVVTNDGLHYTEPIPDFKFVPSFEEIDSSSNALSHGQAMANVGDNTFLWYESWGDGTGVRLAKWQRDRLGYFQQYDYPRRPAYLPPDLI